MKRPSWHEYFLFIAKVVSTRSTCNSRPTGAVIVKRNRILATGYNGAMPKAPHCIEGGEGYCFRRALDIPDHKKTDFCKATHAEANAIVQAAKLGISIDGADIYCTLQPCYTCLKLIVGAGIKRVFFELEYTSSFAERDKFWREEISRLVREGALEFQKIQISDESLSYMLSRIGSLTSERRL